MNSAKPVGPITLLVNLKLFLTLKIIDKAHRGVIVDFKLLVILTVFTPLLIYGQIQSNPESKVESLYNQGQYQKVLQTIDDILRTTKGLPDSTLIHLFTYQSFSYIAIDKREQAKISFRYLLMLNPRLELDPRFVSPKIIEVFEESRRDFKDSLRILPTLYTSTQYNIKRTTKIRSLLYPGLGQLYSGQKIKGRLFISSETVSIAGLIVSHFLTNYAHQKYLNARTENEIKDYYQNYSFWYRCRMGSAISCISIWFLNYIDITLMD